VLVFLKDDGKTENLIYDLPSQLFIKSINEPPVYEFVKSSYYAIALQDETGNRLPFQKGQQVEVMIIAKNYDRETLANKLRDFFKEVQALHADNPLTEEEIEAEIEDYRRGK
jgi:hypothetical protein